MSLADVDAADPVELCDVARHAIGCKRAIDPRDWGLDIPCGSLLDLMIRGGRRGRSPGNVL
jgi:hypothetical protein